MAVDEAGPRPRRSLLYVPAANERALEKARELKSDGLIVDLEDSVTPGAKETARAAAVAAVQAGFDGRETVVRCNGLDTPWGEADLQALVAARPDAVLAPKVSSAAEVHAYDRALAGETRLWIMIETARAALNLREIAETAASTRLEVLVLGPNDLSVELGLKEPMARLAHKTILFQMSIAARAHGLQSLGGVFNEIADLAGFEDECAEEASLGLDGKTLIHPSQIKPANRAFSPSPEELAWARAVVDAFAAPAAKGKGVIRLDGKMIERLHLAQAKRLLGRAL